MAVARRADQARSRARRQETTNGWKYTFGGGRAGSDPALRAALVKYELGAQLPDQVLYPNTTVDDKGEQLTGTRRYVLHFDAGKLPPVATFWNMSMYGSDMLFVENDFGRYSIGSTTDGLKKDADGSLTIVIQKDKPADTWNWLPAPEGTFQSNTSPLWAADADTLRFVPTARSETDELTLTTPEVRCWPSLHIASPLALSR
jgi:hypothetical protein